MKIENFEDEDLGIFIINLVKIDFYSDEGELLDSIIEIIETLKKIGYKEKCDEIRKEEERDK